jgi:hypothetical protein
VSCDCTKIPSSDSIQNTSAITELSRPKFDYTDIHRSNRQSEIVQVGPAIIQSCLEYASANEPNTSEWEWSGGSTSNMPLVANCVELDCFHRVRCLLNSNVGTPKQRKYWLRHRNWSFRAHGSTRCIQRRNLQKELPNHSGQPMDSSDRMEIHKKR